jgi:DMSO/TMAO reductase YedYZ molybdopterin-dependent catalytic subunit
MRHSLIAATLLSTGLLVSGAAFAQSSPSTTAPAQKMVAGKKQKTDGADPTGQYNFSTPGGQYSARPATKQKTDGQDVTGNNNFPAASK